MSNQIKKTYCTVDGKMTEECVADINEDWKEWLDDMSGGKSRCNKGQGLMNKHQIFLFFFYNNQVWYFR